MDSLFDDVSVSDTAEIVCSDDVSIELKKKNIRKCTFFESCSFLFGSPIPCTQFTSFEMRQFIDYIDDDYGMYSVFTPAVYEAARFFDVSYIVNSAPKLIACEITKRIGKSDGIQKLVTCYGVPNKQPYIVKFLTPDFKHIGNFMNRDVICSVPGITTKAIMSDGNIVVYNTGKKCITLFNVGMCVDKMSWVPFKQIRDIDTGRHRIKPQLLVYSGGFIANTTSNVLSIYDNDANLITECVHDNIVIHSALSHDKHLYTFTTDGTIWMWNIIGDIVGKHISGRECDVCTNTVLFKAYDGGNVLLRLRDTNTVYTYTFKDKLCHEQCITGSMYTNNVIFCDGIISYNKYNSHGVCDTFRVQTVTGDVIECRPKFSYRVGIQKIIAKDDYFYVFYVGMTNPSSKTCVVYNKDYKLVREFHICTSDYFIFNVVLYGDGENVVFVANCNDKTLMFDGYGNFVSKNHNRLNMYLDASTYTFGFFDVTESYILTYKPCMVEALIHSSALKPWSKYTTVSPNEICDCDNMCEDVCDRTALCELSLFGKTLRKCVLDIIV